MANLSLPVIDNKKCTICGECVDVCPENVLVIEDSILKFVNPEACTMCAECESVCPEDAVTIHYQIGWADKKEQE